jgi:hypothetical protein
VLAKAVQSESGVRCGEIMRTTVVNTVRLSDGVLRKIYRDPSLVEVQRTVRNATPPRVIERARLLFDNARDVIVDEGTRDSAYRHYKVLLSRRINETENSTDRKDVAYREEVYVASPVWPPYWPYDLLSRRFWTAREAYVARGQLTPRLLRSDPSTGQVVLLLAGGAHSQFDQKIWADARRGYCVSRMEAIDKKGNLRNEVSVRSVRVAGAGWYPERLVERFYAYDGAGGRYLARVLTSVVTGARVNTGIPEGELAFGNILAGTFVQDRRFHPPLAYVQGDRQLTDRELFQLANNRELLYDPGGLARSSQVPSYLLVAVGLVLVSVAGLGLRRTPLLRADRERTARSRP